MRKKQINEIETILRSGSIWLGRKPKDGAILTPHGNIPFSDEEEPQERFRYNEKTDKLIPVNHAKESDNKS